MPAVSTAPPGAWPVHLGLQIAAAEQMNHWRIGLLKREQQTLDAPWASADQQPSLTLQQNSQSVRRRSRASSRHRKGPSRHRKGPRQCSKTLRRCSKAEERVVMLQQQGHKALPQQRLL
jgi:hypothetical protein